MVKDQYFFFDFGNQNKDSGLKASKISFYERRSNLQKTEIIVISLVSKINKYRQYFS